MEIIKTEFELTIDMVVSGQSKLTYGLKEIAKEEQKGEFTTSVNSFFSGALI